MTNNPIQDAVLLRIKLLEVGKEINRPRLGMSKTTKELNEIDEKTCIEASEMLRKLGTEVTRLRLSIGHYLHGKMDRHDLRKASETWNGDAATALAAAKEAT